MAVQLVQDASNSIRKFFEIPLGGGPDDFRIHGSIMMRKAISHSGDCSPRDIRMVVGKMLGEFLDIVADIFDPLGDRVYKHVVLDKVDERQAVNVFLNLAYARENIVKLYAVVPGLTQRWALSLALLYP